MAQDSSLEAEGLAIMLKEENAFLNSGYKDPPTDVGNENGESTNIPSGKRALLLKIRGDEDTVREAIIIDSSELASAMIARVYFKRAGFMS